MSNENIMLYWGSGSTPCWRVMIALDEKSIKYDHKMLSFDKKEHKSEEILKLNPRGQLPTLKIGNLVLNESLGACLYLEDKFKNQGTTLIPNEDAKKVLVLQRMFEAMNLQKFCNENIVYYIWFTPKDKIDQSYLESKKKDLNTELNNWETYLTEQKSQFIAGDEFTMADTIFYPQLAFAVRMGYPISRFPKLLIYYESLKKRASIQNSWPPHWKNTENSTILADC